MALIFNTIILASNCLYAEAPGKPASLASGEQTTAALKTAQITPSSTAAYPWPFITTLKDNTIEVKIDNTKTIMLPNPKINFNFESYSGYKSDINTARKMYNDFFIKYYEEYEKEYFQISPLAKEYNPIQPILGIALDKLKRAPLDDLAKAQNPPVEFKLALDRNVVLFESSQIPKIISALTDIKTQILENKEKHNNPNPQEISHQSESINHLKTQIKQLEYYIYGLAGLSIVLLILVLIIFKKND